MCKLRSAYSWELSSRLRRNFMDRIHDERDQARLPQREFLVARGTKQGECPAEGFHVRNYISKCDEGKE